MPPTHVIDNNPRQQSNTHTHRHRTHMKKLLEVEKGKCANGDVQDFKKLLLILNQTHKELGRHSLGQPVMPKHLNHYTLVLYIYISTTTIAYHLFKVRYSHFNSLPVWMVKHLFRF